MLSSRTVLAFAMGRCAHSICAVQRCLKQFIQRVQSEFICRRDFFFVLCVVSTDLPCLAVVRFIPWRRSQRGVRFVFFRFVLSRRSTRQVGGGRRQQLTTGLRRRRRRRKSLSMRAGTRNCHLSVCSSHTTLACRCADDSYAARI